jgi:acyl-CoA synthetase (NDP forming)
MDAGSIFASTALLRQTLDTVAADPQIDILLLHLGASFAKWFSPQAIAELKACIVSFNRDSPTGKPAVVAIQEQEKPADAAEFISDLRQAGITTYNSLRRACRALHRFTSYHRFVEEIKTDRPDWP